MYKAVTRNIEVTVTPRFLAERSSPDKGYFFWAYTIDIANHGTETVQLKTRHWRITDGNGHVDLRHSVPDVLASTANLLKTAGWRAGGDYHEGSANFEAMREWNRAVIYRKTIAYFADRLVGR